MYVSFVFFGGPGLIEGLYIFLFFSFSAVGETNKFSSVGGKGEI